MSQRVTSGSHTAMGRAEATDRTRVLTARFAKSLPARCTVLPYARSLAYISLFDPTTGFFRRRH